MQRPQRANLTDTPFPYPTRFRACGLVEQLGDGAKDAVATLQAEFARLGRTSDPRVKAAFVMAPQGISFDASGAAAIDRPVFLYYGEDDRVLLPSENALHVAPLIPTPEIGRASCRERGGQ